MPQILRMFNSLVLVCLAMVLPLRSACAQSSAPVTEVQTVNGNIAWFGTSISVSDNFVVSTIVHQNLYLTANGAYYGLHQGKFISYPDIGLKVRNSMSSGIFRAQVPTVSKSDIGALKFLRASYNLNFIPAVVPFLVPTASSDFGTSTFFVSGNGFRRAFQFDYGKSFGINLIATPFFPLTFAVQSESELSTDFLPLITWNKNQNTQSGALPFDDALTALKKFYSGSKAGSTEALMLRKIAGELITLINNQLKSPVADEMRDFANSTDGSSKIDKSIDSAQDWANSGADFDKSAPKWSETKPAHFSETSAWSLGSGISSLVSLSNQTIVRRRCKETGTCDKVFADCHEIITCQPGEVCSIEVPASEASELVAGSSAGDFEGEKVEFDAPYPGYQPDKDDKEGEAKNLKRTQVFKDKKAVFSFVSTAAELATLSVVMPKSKKTGDKELNLCLRMIEQRPLVELVGPRTKEKGDTSGKEGKRERKVTKRVTISEDDKKGIVFKVQRSNTDLDKPLEVKYFLSGKAKEGKDFKKLKGSVTIAASKNSANVVIKPLHNKKKKGNSTFKVTLEPDLTYGIVEGKDTLDVVVTDVPAP